MERVFSIQQFYKIQSDKSIIDKRIDEMTSSSLTSSEAEAWKEEDRQRFHRLYKVIIENKALLDEILLYTVIQEHDLKMEYQMYVKEHYKEQVSFFDILFKHIGLFSSDDQQWINDLNTRMESHEDDDEDDDDPLAELEILEEAFSEGVQPFGFTIGEMPRKMFGP